MQRMMEIFRHKKSNIMNNGLACPHKPFIKIPYNVFARIKRDIGNSPAETGGMLLGDRKEPLSVVDFYFDSGGSTCSYGYDPDYVNLNKVLKGFYEPRGLDFLGFVHSHPPGVRRPSNHWRGRNIGDMAYAQATLSSNPDLEIFLMPIIMTLPDFGRFEILPYVVYRENPNVAVEAEIEIIPPNQHLMPESNFNSIEKKTSYQPSLVQSGELDNFKPGIVL